MLYVTHDLATARHFSSEIMVMYRGEIVEHGPSDEVILRPSHPYTQILAGAAPDPTVSRKALAEARRARQAARASRDAERRETARGIRAAGSAPAARLPWRSARPIRPTWRSPQATWPGAGCSATTGGGRRGAEGTGEPAPDRAVTRGWGFRLVAGSEFRLHCTGARGPAGSPQWGMG